MASWFSGEVEQVRREELGDSYNRYRLAVPEAEEAMAGSLARYGQLSPLVGCRREGRIEVVDGFKRLAAARTVRGMTHLAVRVIEADERTVKAAIYVLNCLGRRIDELEEAWLVQALVREDGLTQVEVAELLGRHKSWVCRRLALLEKLADEARDELRLGLLSPTAARQLTRLPAGNQAEVLAAVHRESLTAAELRGLADLLLAAASRPQVEYLLEKPREALRQANDMTVPAWDPRLSRAGNRVAKQLGLLLDLLGRMEHWLRLRGRAELAACDRGPLAPAISRLSREARTVAELAEDLYAEIHLP